MECDTSLFYLRHAFFLLPDPQKGAIIHCMKCGPAGEVTLEQQVLCRMAMFSNGALKLATAQWLAGVLLLLCPALTPVFAQTLIQGSGPGDTVRIFNTDAAVLESQDVRKDLPCSVTP